MDANLHADTHLCQASSAEQLFSASLGHADQSLDAVARLKCVALSEPGSAPDSSQDAKPTLNRSGQIKTQRRRRTSPTSGGGKLPSCPPSPFANPDVQAETVSPEPVKPGQLGYQSSVAKDWRSSSPCQRTTALGRNQAADAQQLPTHQVTSQQQVTSHKHVGLNGPGSSPTTPSTAYVRLQHQSRFNSPARSHANSVVSGAPVRLVAGFPVSSLSSPKSTMPTSPGATYHPTALGYPHGSFTGQHKAIGVQSMTRKVAGAPTRLGAQHQDQDLAPLPVPVKTLITTPSTASRSSSSITDGLVNRHGCQAGWRWLASIFCASKQ